MRMALVTALAIAALGCRYRAEVVPVWGDTSDLDRLAGEWAGEYSSPDSRRTGTITFMITARGDSAFGEVLMVIPTEENVPRPVDLVTGHSAHARSADLLSVQFVRVAGGGVRGERELFHHDGLGREARRPLACGPGQAVGEGEEARPGNQGIPASSSSLLHAQNCESTFSKP